MTLLERYNACLTLLSDFTFTFHSHALKKEMATHTIVLAWRIPGMGEPGGLPSRVAQSRTQLKRLSSSSSNACLGTDTDSWLESLSFGRSYYFWRWMAWTWDRGKRVHEIALLPTGSQAVPTAVLDWDYKWLKEGNTRVTLSNVFLKDSSE